MSQQPTTERAAENDYDVFAAAYASDDDSNAWHYERPAVLRLAVLDEPQPDAAVRDLDPATWKQPTTRSRFIFSATGR